MNYKSLDSYQNFVKGWVRQVLVRPVRNKRILIGRLVGALFFNRASDRCFLNEKPLTPWILSQIEGTILAAHCDCMAELREALWVISVGVEKRDSLTVTQKSAYLVMLPAIRSVSYAPVKEIDFIGKKKKAPKGINDDSASSSRKRKKFDIPTLEEKKFLFLGLKQMCKASNFISTSWVLREVYPIHTHFGYTSSVYRSLQAIP